MTISMRSTAPTLMLRMVISSLLTEALLRHTTEAHLRVDERSVSQPAMVRASNNTRRDS